MKISFLLIFFSLFLWSETLNEQIHALEEARPKERVELMNHIKEQLISMNETERMKTLGILKAKLHPKEEDSSTIKHEHVGKNQEHSHKSESQDRMQKNIEHSSPMMDQGRMNSEMMRQEERMNQEWQQQRGGKENQSSPHEGERNIPNRHNENQNHGGR